MQETHPGTSNQLNETIMCKYNYFYSLDELNQYASENGINIDESDLQPFRMQPDEWLAGLALDGVTELCKVWRASVYSEQRTHIQCFRGVRVVGTGTVLIPTTPPNHSGCSRPGSWHFTLFGTEPLVLMGTNIRPTMEKPNGIGKMNRKALDRWLEYLEAAQTELREVEARCRRANQSHLQRVLNKFPDAEVRYGAGGLAERIKVRHGFLIIIWEGTHRGSFLRNVALDTSLIPQDDVILGVC